MTNTKLTDTHLAVKSELDGYRMHASRGQHTARAMVRLFESIDCELTELQERRNADGAEPVSFDSLNAAVAEVTGCNQHAWNAAIYKGHHPVPSMNYNSLARIVDMYRSPQPTPAISCPKPVVKLPTTRCWAGISNFYYAADVIAAIRAAGVEVSND
ncbi:hypothetical protein ACSMCO_19480 [Salmonella enterica]|uniref:hypothetical protein n=1 Tax=Salmonella enterica TaxID=28901 RepID=UPI001D5BDA7B|nr:hypothetical protein [Salmonella enterica]EGG4130788.1 hypothetical protein [Salmonella enterica]